MAFKAKTTNSLHRSRTTDEAVSEVLKEEVKSIIIKVPESKHRQFKVRTSERGETMQQILERAIDSYIGI